MLREMIWRHIFSLALFFYLLFLLLAHFCCISNLWITNSIKNPNCWNRIIFFKMGTLTWSKSRIYVLCKLNFYIFSIFLSRSNTNRCQIPFTTVKKYNVAKNTSSLLDQYQTQQCLNPIRYKPSEKLIWTAHEKQ